MDFDLHLAPLGLTFCDMFRTRLALLFEYPFGHIFFASLAQFWTHFGYFFLLFSNNLEMCWERFSLESQPLPAPSGGINFHTFLHHVFNAVSDLNFHHFFIDFGSIWAPIWIQFWQLFVYIFQHVFKTVLNIKKMSKMTSKWEGAFL